MILWPAMLSTVKSRVEKVAWSSTFHIRYHRKHSTRTLQVVGILTGQTKPASAIAETVYKDILSPYVTTTTTNNKQTQKKRISYLQSGPLTSSSHNTAHLPLPILIKNINPTRSRSHSPVSSRSSIENLPCVPFFIFFPPAYFRFLTNPLTQGKCVQ